METGRVLTWAEEQEMKRSLAKVRERMDRGSTASEPGSLPAEGTMVLDTMMASPEENGYMTKIVKLADHGHDVVRHPNNKDLIHLVCPTALARTPPVPQASRPPPMNASNVLSLSNFLSTGLINSFVVPATRDNSTKKYFGPVILALMIGRHVGFGARMYFDKYSYDFWRLVKCAPVDFRYCLNAGDYNLQDEQTTRDTDALMVALKTEYYPKIEALWARFVAQRWSVADAFTHMLWYIMSGYDENYVHNWQASAQVFVVDLMPVRPEWHESIQVSLKEDDWQQFWNTKKKETRYRFPIHGGYVASVYRMYAARQSRDINATIDGVDVLIRMPTSIHIRDAHATCPNSGDFKHAVEDFSRIPGKAYEWCITPAVYQADWANFNVPRFRQGSGKSHTPIFCYVNAKRTTPEGPIMNDEDYYSSFGLMWDRKMMYAVTLFRWERMTHRSNAEHAKNKGCNLYYGIDEILATLGTGYINVAPNVGGDPWSQCFNDPACRSAHSQLRSVKPFSAEEIKKNPLMQHAHRPRNSIMEKSIVLPIVFLWNGGFWNNRVGLDRSTGEYNKERMARESVSFANMEAKYFFPLPRYVADTQRYVADPRRARAPALPAPPMPNVQAPNVVRGLLAATVFDDAVAWAYAGYAGRADFERREPNAHERVSDEQLLQEYDAMDELFRSQHFNGMSTVAPEERASAIKRIFMENVLGRNYGGPEQNYGGL
jgi:hypothetical protein